MDPAERRHRWTRRPRRRFSRTRALRAFVHMPGSVNLVIGFAALALVVTIGAVVLDIHYHDPGSDRTLGPFQAFYLALSLVVVSPVAALPVDGPSRAVFVLIPAAGLLLRTDGGGTTGASHA